MVGVFTRPEPDDIPHPPRIREVMGEQFGGPPAGFVPRNERREAGFITSAAVEKVYDAQSDLSAVTRYRKSLAREI